MAQDADRAVIIRIALSKFQSYRVSGLGYIWMLGDRFLMRPCQHVPFRSIAQAITVSRRATATMAIFFREPLPRRTRSYISRAHGLYRRLIHATSTSSRRSN